MKRKIAIVAGGFSSEYDVSLRSAQGIYEALDQSLYAPTIIEIPHTRDKEKVADALQQLKEFDFAYITIHGTPGENGLLQGYLEMLNIPFNCCGVLPAALTFNKYACNHYLSTFGVKIAKSFLLRKGEPQPTARTIANNLHMPCFIKSNVGGSSFGCSKVKTIAMVEPAIELAFKEGDEVICEQMLTGTEVTCGAFKTRDGITVLPITEVVTENEFFDYDAKYNGQVQEITPARIPDAIRDEVQALTKKIYTILGCSGIIRVDYILSIDHRIDTFPPRDYTRINLLEVNTTPGMTPTSFLPQQIRAAGLNLTDVLTEQIEQHF